MQGRRIVKKPVICLLLISPLLAPAAPAADLVEIYEQALLSDPLLREAEANRQAILQTKPQALGSLLPQVDAGADYTDTNSSGRVRQFFGAFGFDRTSDDQNDGWSWNVQLRQTLFRWDQLMRLKQSNKTVAQAETDFLAAQQDLMTRVAIAYFDVLAAEDTLESVAATKEAVGRQLEQASKRFEVGLIAITDVQEAQAAYDEAVAAEIDGKRAVAVRREVLREITGQYTTELSFPEEEIPLITPVPEDQNQWVETALQQNLALMSAEIGAEITRDDIDIARNGHLPTVDLVASYNTQLIEGTTEGPTGVGGAIEVGETLRDLESTTISVQFAVPIFSGGTTSAQVKEAVYRHRAAKERLERVARETERATRDAYLGVTTEIARVKALKQALTSAQTALKATEAGFEVGTRTTVDVLNSRRTLFQAETDYARSRYDYIINVLLLKQAAGILTPDDVVEVNGWLASTTSAQ
jgi:outer membrane protein